LKVRCVVGFTVPRDSKDVSVVICGEAGQGLQKLEGLIARTAMLSGYHVFSSSEYMSRIRGGANSMQIRLSPERVSALIDRTDLLITLGKGTAEHLKERVNDTTLILGEADYVSEELKTSAGAFIEVPIAATSKAVGSAIYSAEVVLGILARLFDFDLSIIKARLKATFKNKGAEIVEKNIAAATAGIEAALTLIKSGKVSITLKKSQDGSKRIIIRGSQAVALGAIAGGCSFMAAYPMSPSTGVFNLLSKYSKDFNIITEQCEDEIAAINMALGAWYAGARALVSTSGGGFALMEEGLSLSAMIESPLVVHLAQRPGPATGLPTRTEQGDLELALHAGHGEFPRIILAPGSLEEAFSLTRRAFDLADRYQVPVFILTDQYLIDSVVDTAPFDIEGVREESYIVETTADYKRYAFTADGVSPRGIPSHGEGFVCVDSDEHDEDGRITEDMAMRKKMVDKRLWKLNLIKQDIIPPIVMGEKNAKLLVLGWGSTMPVIKEALTMVGDGEVTFIHNPQPYPLHLDTIDHIKKAGQVVVVEGNATGQFARLVKAETNVEAKSILKYDGLQFSAEEIAEKIGALL
jgi:2-oxoglutarate ferredoxin oxidoreductase subunit alpha